MNTLNQPAFPHFYLPEEEDMLLFLIQKELQGTRFTNDLAKLGFDGSLYSPDLGSVILSLAGINNRSDVVWNWYYTELDRLSEQVDLHDLKTARVTALEFYGLLKQRLTNV